MNYSFFSLFLLLSSLCFGNEDKKPLVITTIAPYSSLVKKLGGDLVHVQTLVPKEANAHLYEPSPKEMAPLKTAQLWVRAGEIFEEKLYPTLKLHNPHLHILETWLGLSLITHSKNENHTGHCGSWDRHLWLSPRMLQQIVPKIAQALITLLPEHRSYIEKREKNLIEELKALDARITALLAQKKGTALLVAHPSFGYFCRDYHLKQLSIENEGKDPLPKQLQKIFEEAKKHPINLIVLQPQFPKQGAKRFADKLNLSLYTMDPYDDDTCRNLEAFAERIAQERSVHEKPLL